MAKELLSRTGGASCPSFALPFLPHPVRFTYRMMEVGGRGLVHRVFAGNLCGGLFWPVAM